MCLHGVVLNRDGLTFYFTFIYGVTMCLHGVVLNRDRLTLLYFTLLLFMGLPCVFMA
jgi:hypothetical protein